MSYNRRDDYRRDDYRRDDYRRDDRRDDYRRDDRRDDYRRDDRRDDYRRDDRSRDQRQDYRRDDNRRDDRRNDNYRRDDRGPAPGGRPGGPPGGAPGGPRPMGGPMGGGPGTGSMMPFIGSEYAKCDSCGKLCRVGKHADVPNKRCCSGCWDRFWADKDRTERGRLMASERDALRQRAPCRDVMWNAVNVSISKAEVYMYPLSIEKNENISEIQRKKLLFGYLRQVLEKEYLKKLDLIISGTNFYCLEDISEHLQEPLSREVSLGSFKTTMELRKEDITKVQLNPRSNEEQTMQVYNHVLCRILESLDLRRTGKIYCDFTRQRVYRDMIVVPGYFATFQLTDNGVVLIVHPRSHVEARVTALDYLNKNGPRSLLGLKVMTSYGTRKRNYMVYKVDKGTTVESVFELKSGRTISYADYYKETYGLEVTKTDQPLIWGERSGRVRLIPEFVLVDQLSTEARRFLPTRCSKMPEEMQDQCIKLVKRFDEQEPKELLSGYCLQIKNAALETIQPKEMKTVKVQIVGSPETLRPNQDFAPQTMRIQFNEERKEYQVFGWGAKARDLVRQIMDVNERIRGVWKAKGPVTFVDSGEDDRDFIDKCLDSVRTDAVRQAIAEGTPALVLCVLSNGHSTRGQDAYGTLKSELGSMGIVSQFVDFDKMSKAKTAGPYVHNIAKNVTAKMGTPLWLVDIPSNVPELGANGTIYVGYDIYSDRKSEASESGSFENQRRNLAGFVAWYYNAETRKWSHLCNTDMQVSRQKMMGGSSTESRRNAGAASEQTDGRSPVMDRMSMTTLKEFLEEVFEVLVKGSNVGRVVVYRDGVGDSMMDRVRVEEMADCEKLLGSKNVELTFMVVQKRIHDRYAAPVSKGGRVEWHNIPRGHVVEHSSHSFSQIAVDCTLATSKPVKYFVLRDGGLPLQAIENMSYHLCWMYTNWPGSIKAPFVLQCASKLAFFHGTSSAAKPNVGMELRQMPYYL